MSARPLQKQPARRRHSQEILRNGLTLGVGVGTLEHMFDDESAWEEDPEGRAIIDALEHIDRLLGRVVPAIGQYDAGGGWARHGTTSMTAWLKHHGDRTPQDAARLVRMAALLRSLPD